MCYPTAFPTITPANVPTIAPIVVPTSVTTPVTTSATTTPTRAVQSSTVTPTTLLGLPTSPATLPETVTTPQATAVSTPLLPTLVGSDTITQSTDILVATPTLPSAESTASTPVNPTAEATATEIQLSDTSIVIVNLTDCSTMLPIPKIWKGALQAQCDRVVTHDGYPSLWLNTLDTWAVVERYSPLIPVEPNQPYALSYWVKTDVTFQLADMYGKVITSEYYSVAREEDAVNENRIGAGFATGRSIGDKTDWTYQSYQFTTRADTTFVRQRAVMGGPDQTGGAKGSMWISQLSLHKIIK